MHKNISTPALNVLIGQGLDWTRVFIQYTVVLASSNMDMKKTENLDILIDWLIDVLADWLIDWQMDGLDD